MSGQDVDYTCVATIAYPNPLGLPETVVSTAVFICPVNLAEGSAFHFEYISRHAHFSNGTKLVLPATSADAGMAEACQYCRHQLRCLDRTTTCATETGADEVLSPGFIMEPVPEVI